MTDMATKLRVVLADDERPARAVLAKLLRSFSDVELIGEAENGTAMVELIEHADPDLALIDLQMPGLDGLGVARKFKAADRPLIVFVTAHDEYAVGAFEVQALDYLLKPVDRRRLADTLSRARARLEQLAIADYAEPPPGFLEPEPATNGAAPRVPTGLRRACAGWCCW